MSKKRPIIVKHASVDLTHMLEKQLVLIEVADWSDKSNHWSFYVPYSTKDKFGFIPGEVIRARMLRDFNVQLELYSICIKSIQGETK